MANPEQIQIMDSFEEQHPEYTDANVGFNKECALYQKDGEYMFVNWQNERFGPYTLEAVYNLARAVWIKDVESLNGVEKKLIKSCPNTLFQKARDYAAEVEPTSIAPYLVEGLLRLLQPLEIEAEAEGPDLIELGKFREQMNAVFKVGEDQATVIDDVLNEWL